MSILSLTTTHFRNIKDHSHLLFHPKLNLVIGDNASGKTTLLEAIYYLSTGKSFRTRSIDNIIKTAEDSNPISDFVVYGQLQRQLDTACSENGIGSEDEEGFVGRSQPVHSVGIKRSKSDKSLIKVDGESISSASVLAQISPTLIIQPSSFELLDGSPKVRRKFLDWGVFHVEHSFAQCWKEYIYCLKQRNTLLRNARIDDLQLRIWDKRLIELGQGIDQHRTAFLEHYNRCLNKRISEFGLPEDLQIRYYKGWEKSKSLDEAIEQSRFKDMERKYTQHGPHRADIKITLKGKTAEQTLSRGQQKLLVLAMHLAHIELINQLTSKASVTLIDDVTAELDQANLSLIFDCLVASNTQVICTGIESERIERLLDNTHNFKMFHVKHGVINEKN